MDLQKTVLNYFTGIQQLYGVPLSHWQIIVFIPCLLAVSCSPPEEITDIPSRPNIILIMADDMGYECLGSNGSLSYQTPRLDSLAEGGIRFSQCISQPLCTPSRVKMMTGVRNYRNYEYFGHLKNGQQTFGHLMKDAGYVTGIAGKWQLNGVNHKDQIPDWNDPDRPFHFGFDTYCLWQLTHERKEGERYAAPMIEQDGKILETTIDDYGPDIFVDFVLDFMETYRDTSFFIYYPMVLVHEPFVPTPDSRDWQDVELRHRKDTAYFRDMMLYTDKIVGRIADKVNELGIGENTILIFTADNGTDVHITTQTVNGPVRGGKGSTLSSGVHVPLIIHWNKMKEPGRVYDRLIEFSDFFATFADLARVEMPHDGISFLGLLNDGPFVERKTVFVHYDPHWGRFSPGRFVQTIDYKLYDNGQLFDIRFDPDEKTPLPEEDLSPKEKEIRARLQEELNGAPEWNDKQNKE